ncbi:MAG: RagB/SusD family nutrient uptake outer membrane protein [Chitinophagaceae bacterium]
MKSIIIKTILPLATGIIFFSSCTKVLDRQPELYVDESQSIVDKKSADAALIGAYNSLSQNSNQGVTFRYAVNLLSDNLKWVGNSPTNREFDVYGIFATNSRVSELWAAIYKTINISNNIIATVPAINDVTFSQADRNNSRGEAFFLRAYSYFDLVRLWGNVPIQTKPTKTTADAEGIGNSTAAVVYKQVEQDLDSAETLLSSTVNRNRANKFTAKALKARLYLYLKEWAKAESYATELINSTANFKLVKPYNLFYASKNTTESIFEIDYTINNKNSWASNWFASNITGGKKELLPTDEFIALAKDPTISGDRSALLLTVSGVTYGNMNFKIATGDDQVYAIRIAEMYLIRAEARTEKSTPDFLSALEDLNAVRSRANAPAIATVADKNELIDKILLERRIEFAYESQRWFDLIRKGKAQSVLGITDATKLLFPIPKQQILVNPALVQNPGYN